MKRKLAMAVVALLVVSLVCSPSFAMEKLKIAVMHSLTGAFALAGGVAGQRGSLAAIDMWNARGGIQNKYEIVPVEADAQSNPDIAIREAERLINVEKVPVILGIYSSAIAVPLAPICDKNKTILWITVAIADGVLENRNLQYVFRAQPMGSQFGESSVVLLRDHYAKLGYKSPAEVKVAVIYEDGPYGVSVKEANLLQAKNNQMKVLLTEGYDHKTKDLSSLVLKLKAAKPDVLLHTGYYPDIVLFLRQAREMGLQVKAIIGHGAGYDNFQNLEKQLGPELGRGGFIPTAHTRPCCGISNNTHHTVLDGMANPMPCAYAMMAVFTPTTCARESSSGPPELPGLSGSVCWMMFSISRPVSLRMLRPSAKNSVPSPSGGGHLLIPSPSGGG